VNTVLPLASSLVSFAFAGLVLDQWREKRRPFQLVWALGLIWYGIAAGTEFVGSAFGWSEPIYRAWYLCGALYTAAYLGAGTIYLLRKTRFGYFAAASIVLGGLLAVAVIKRYPGSAPTAYTVFVVALVAGLAVAATTTWRRELTAHAAMGFLALASLTVAYLVLTAPLNSPGYTLDPATHVPTGSAMPNYIRVLSGPFNVAGALCLVFGAIYSAYVYMPKNRVLPARLGIIAVAVNLVASLPKAVVALFQGNLNSRVPATILIAIGGFIPALTSSLNRFGVTWTFFLGEFLGIVLILTGFLVSEEIFHRIWNPLTGRVRIREAA
jgi:hypothetical protein